MSTSSSSLSSSLSPSPIEILNKPFILKETKPITLTDSKDKQVAVLFVHQTSAEFIEKVAKLAFEIDNCRECKHRSIKLCKLANEEGSVFLKCLDVFVTEADKSRKYKEIYALAQEVENQPIIDIIVLRGNSVLDLTLDAGKSPAGQSYHHWTLAIPENLQTDATIDKKRLGLYQKAFHRYIPEMLPAMIQKLCGHGSAKELDDVQASLLLMQKCLHKASYGNKWLPSLNWLLEIVIELKSKATCFKSMKAKERWLFCAKHLLKSPIDSDNDDAVCPFFHTSNGNIIDLLQTALSESAMISMIADRLSPLNYMRRDPDADISDNVIKIAMERLGDFSNKIMTVDEAAKLPHALKLSVEKSESSGNSSSLASFEKLMDINKKSVDHKAAGKFAERSGYSEKKNSILSIESVDALLNYLSENTSAHLEVETIGNCIVYVASTTLKQEALCVPHPWVFVNKHVDLGFHTSWVTVSLIVPMYKYIERYQNFLLVLKNAKPKEDLPNCNFPEMLSSDYKRTCGKAFERLNTVENLTAPENPAIGVGSSGHNDKGDLQKHVNIKLDGNLVVIKRLRD